MVTKHPWLNSLGQKTKQEDMDMGRGQVGQGELTGWGRERGESRE